MGPHRYYEEEEPSFRRYNARGHGYPLSHDRDLPQTSLHSPYDIRRGLHSSLHETRGNDNAAEQDSNARPRSRIPVACGRCRKRKIRCSGDNGSGGPCTNCKTAGNEDCVYLRVSSTEAPLKIDNSVSEYFDAASATSRLSCRMASQPPQYVSTHSPSNVNFDPYQYRNNSVTGYQQFSGKQYYTGIPSFNEYDENVVEYGLQQSGYQIMPQDHIEPTSPNSNLSFGTCGPIRGWTPALQLPKTNTLFIEQEQPLFGNGQLPYNSGGNFPQRNMSSDAKGMSLGGISTLSTPVSGIDRVLPNPAAIRPGQIGVFLRNNDGLVPMAQQNYEPHGIYMTANMLNGSRSPGHNGISENAYNISMSSTSPESIASSHIYTGSENSVSLNQHQGDIYSPNDGLHYRASEPSESSYGHSSNSRQGSHSSRTTQHEGSLPSVSEGDLSNGQHYVPYHSSSASYPTPPMNIPPPAPIHPRASIQSVQ